MDGLGEGRGRHDVGDADERDLHGDLLDEQGEPAGGVQQAAYVVTVRLEVDGMSAGGLHPVQEQVDGRTGERLVVAGDERRARRARRARPAGRPSSREVTARRASVVEDIDLLEGRARAGWDPGRGRRPRGGCRCRPWPGTARPRRSRRASGGTSRASRQAERTSSARCIPRALTHVLSRPGGRVAREQGLPAAGGTDDADPARGRQRRGEASLSLLATETWGEHGANLSVRAPPIR